MKRHNDHNNSYEIQLGLAYHFRDLVSYYHSGKHWDTQADMGLEKWLRVLHLEPKAAGRETLDLV